MAVFRNQVARKFVQIRNSLLADPALSWKAKGILSYLLSKPSTWTANSTDIERRATEGITAVRSGLEELETTGYIVRGQERDASGQFVGYIFDVYDIPRPQDERSNPSDRKHENTVYGKPDNGKPNTTNTDSSNTEKENTEVSDDSEDEFTQAFGPDPVTEEAEHIDWTDPDVRNKRIIAATQKFAERVGQSPWMHWCPDHIYPRGGIEKQYLQHVSWLINEITGIHPKSDSVWRRWRPAYESMYKEAQGNFDIIEEAIRSKWPEEVQYRSSVPSKYTEAVTKIAADWESRKPKKQSRKVWEM